jgi:hypothetical protein
MWQHSACVCALGNQPAVALARQRNSPRCAYYVRWGMSVITDIGPDAATCHCESVCDEAQNPRLPRRTVSLTARFSIWFVASRLNL